MARPLKEDLQLIDGSFYVTVKVASQLCGVGTQTLRNWRDRPSPPPYNKDIDMYPVIELGEWIRTEQIYKQGVGGTFPYKPDFTRYGDTIPVVMPGLMPGVASPEPEKRESQKDRYDRLKADKLEIEINEKVGNLVLGDEVLLAMSSIISRVKTRILALPSQLAMTLSHKDDPVDIQDYMEDEIRIAMEELTPDWPREIDFETDGEDDVSS